VSQIQIERCAARIRDPAARDRFQRMMSRADELTFQAAKLRLEAWADYRRATGETKRSEKVVGQYA
jgi:hypothetical protein